jgi:hypothetical protein
MRNRVFTFYFISKVPQSELDLDIVKTILSEYRIHNADVTLRYDATADDLIDIIEGNRAYIPCIYLLNKIGTTFSKFYTYSFIFCEYWFNCFKKFPQTKSASKNWMSFTKFPIVYPSLPITNGISTTFSRRCGNTSNLCECTSVWNCKKILSNDFLFSFSYTKPKGQLPDYNAPVVLQSDRCTMEEFCNKLHRTILKEFK